MTRVVQALADAIAHQGVGEVFALLGSSNFRVVHHLVEDHRISLRQARHEAGAVGAADGYGRVTGTVGFCTVTAGPGFTNTITALMTASKAHTPLVMLTGSTAGVPGRTRPFAVNMSLDPVPLLDAVGIPSLVIRPETVHADVATAFCRAQQELTPVVLVLMSQVEDDEAGDSPGPVDQADPIRPAPEDVRMIVDLLASAERPLILGGFGAVRAGAGPALTHLAAHAGALLATTLRGSGLFADDPYDLGVAGGFGWPPATDLMAQADLILAMGAGLNDFTTRKGELTDDRTIIQVDVRDHAFGRHTPVAHRVIADAGTTAQAALDEARARMASRAGWRRPDIIAPVRGHAGETYDDESDDGLVDPRALCDALDDLLPRERTLAIDGGHFALFAATHLSVPDPHGLVWTLDFGATGGGLGAAIGAAHGRPDRLTVLVIGDGGYLMSLGDIDDVVRDAVPILIVIMNNEAYASEVALFERHGMPAHHSRFVTPPLAEVAVSLGAEGRTITDLRQLDQLPTWIENLDGPLVLDCRVKLMRPRVLAAL